MTAAPTVHRVKQISSEESGGAPSFLHLQPQPRSASTRGSCASSQAASLLISVHHTSKFKGGGVAIFFFFPPRAGKFLAARGCCFGLLHYSARSTAAPWVCVPPVAESAARCLVDSCDIVLVRLLLPQATAAPEVAVDARDPRDPAAEAAPRSRPTNV